MKIFPTTSIKQLDADTIKNEPIASIDLMERASRALARAIAERWEPDTPLTVFAGPGNNGGDALALARLLAGKGYRLEVYDICKAFYAPGNMVLAAAGDTTMEQILAACERHGLMRPRSTERVQRLWKPEPMTLAAAHKTLKMPVSKPCFGVGFKEKPLPPNDLRTEALYDLILSCITGGMSPLYRRLYDGGLVNPGFGGEVLRVDGCCCILFTGESDAPDAVKQMLLDEIARIRAAGVDREIFTLCKNEKYGQLIENLENVEDSASQMADFALSGQTVAQQITMLAGLTAEDADAALQHILSTDRMAVMDILPDGTAPLAENEEEAE